MRTLALLRGPPSMLGPSSWGVHCKTIKKPEFMRSAALVPFKLVHELMTFCLPVSEHPARRQRPAQP